MCVRDRVQVSPGNRTGVNRRSVPLGEDVRFKVSVGKTFPEKL